MISEKMQDALINIYFKYCDRLAWIEKFRSIGFCKEWIDFLCDFDDSYSKTWKTRDRFKKENQFNYDIGLYDADPENIQIKFLTKRITEAYQEYERSFDNDELPINRLVLFEFKKVDQLESLRRQIRSRQLHEQGRFTAGEIDDFMIGRAKDYPIEKIPDEVRKNRIRCPFHDGKDFNMSFKNNFAYCFVCHEWADSIKLAMKMWNLGFVDAVKKMQ